MADATLTPTSNADDTRVTAPPGVSKDPIPPDKTVPEATDDSKHKPCPGCGSTNKRNLVVCIDGTSNQFSTKSKNTNVVELYSRLEKDNDQLTFYNSGIGTYAKPSWKSWSYRKQVIANKLDLAFALRFEKIILSAYAWLVDNYQPGDRIFLFGFSRGAYQVRALAAMIDIVGLLYKGNDDQIPFAYELYAAWEEPGQKSASPSTEDEEMNPPALEDEEPNPSMQAQFKSTFSRKRIRVHFVGAWDTVSSVGFIRDKTLPKTTDGMKCACYFRHALALHEFRVKFLPEYVNGNRGPDHEELSEGAEPHTKEVWFSGSHSDIGGGSTTNTDLDKFGPALRWMSYEATLAGLRFEEGRRKWEQGSISTSMTTVWRIVEYLPIKRLLYDEHSEEKARNTNINKRHRDTERSKTATTWLPHRSACRKIQPGQSIYWWVSRKDVPFDIPEFVPIEGDAHAQLVLRPHKEALRRGRILDDQNSALFKLLISSEDGLESLKELDVIGYIYDFARSLQHAASLEQQLWADLRMLYDTCFEASQKLEKDMHLPNANTSSATFPLEMCGHENVVSSVAFLSDTRVVSGSWDKTLRIWDVITGEMTLGSPLSGHGHYVNYVAVHAAKGLVASASDDSTIRLWSSDSNGAVHAGKVLQDGSSHGVLAVAFSSDGSHLVSGSKDGAIRVWNTATGERVGEPVRGHTDWVWSVAFSSDGKRIVSGSSDCTVLLWEWSPDDATLQPCGGPLIGHADWVFSIAFSPDARVIASGSLDNTVRIWDVATRTSKLTLVGHTYAVNSVAFAPSGKHVVSCSSDWTVRIWDARTGDAVQALQGHTWNIMSVAFSPDGTRIASGSRDTTVRVWDFVVSPDKSHPNEDVQAARAQIELA